MQIKPRGSLFGSLIRIDIYGCVHLRRLNDNVPVSTPLHHWLLTWRLMVMMSQTLCFRVYCRILDLFQYGDHTALDHYNDVTMGAIASQITSLTIVFSTVYSDADQRKHQSSASLAFVRGIHRGPVSSPHKWPVTRKIFPFDDVIMLNWGIHQTQRPAYVTIMVPEVALALNRHWTISNHHQQQAITRANIDQHLYRHVASLGYNEFS